jgi:hypothetical protein
MLDKISVIGCASRGQRLHMTVTDQNGIYEEIKTTFVISHCSVHNILSCSALSIALN